MKCYYHNDLDGRCAGAIVAHYEQNYNKEDYFEVDYSQDLPIDCIEKDELVYLVDYSFKKNTVWQLDKILETTKNVIWCDHHTSSINLLKERKDLFYLQGIVRDKEAGCALIYQYLYNKEFKDIPWFIQLVSDYDCWIYKYGDSTVYFKLGIESDTHDALDNIWTELFSDEDDALEYIMNDGISIKSYIDQDNKYYLDRFGYESELNGIKCYCVNRKSNSWIFGKKYEEYPMVVVYAFDGEKFEYSLFSSDKDIDCSKIAESFGGGGHKGAAGFISKELLLLKRGE